MYIFIDIDGTLLNDEHKLSNMTKCAISKYKNHNFFLMSARKPSAIRQIKDELNINESIYVCYNGALIIERNNIIYESYIDPFKVLRFYDMSLKYGLSISLYSEDKWFVERESIAVNKESEIIGENPIVTRFDINMFTKVRVHKILLMGYPNKINSLKREAENDVDIQMVNSKKNYCEITTKDACKEQAFLFLKSYLGFNIDNTMAIGDGENDINLLKMVKIGVAMGNAPLSVKLHADYVTESNNSNGVAIALNEWLGA